MPEPLLQLTAVSKSYPTGGNGGNLTILSSIDLQLDPGDSLAIIGPSGSGKSTLLNIIGTLDRPTSGKVLLGGKDLTQLDDLALADVRNTQIGFIFQAHHLLPQCTVLENVLVPTLASKDKQLRAQAPARAELLLKRIGLAERLDHRPGQLSGGERQRVAVVRALINNPKLLLADEPTGSLDHASASNLALLLTELNKEEHVSLIVVTHALELAQKMRRVVRLKDGALARE